MWLAMTWTDDRFVIDDEDDAPRHCLPVAALLRAVDSLIARWRERRVAVDRERLTIIGADYSLLVYQPGFEPGPAIDSV